MYPWYALTFNAYAWLPVFFLYFSERLSLENVLRLEAIYYVSVVLLEVPSGYFSDVIGRRATLLVSSSALIVAYVLFVVDTSFTVFVAAQVLLAVGISFNSGTDTSIHYESLKALDRDDEFAAREAIAARNGLFAGAGAAFLGGCVGLISLRLAYVLSVVIALATFFIVLAFVEPRMHHHPDMAPMRKRFIDQIFRCVRYLRRAPLMWLFGFYVLMTILNHVPYEFYQPYISLSADDIPILASTTPFVAGIHTALALLLASIVADRSIRVRDRIGIIPTLLVSTLIQIVVIGVMGFMLSAWVIPLILLRVVPRALMTAPLNAAVTPQIDSAHRATYLSGQSLAGRLAFSGVLFQLSFLVGPTGATDWTSLSSMLQLTFIIGIVGLTLLALSSRMLTSRLRAAPMQSQGVSDKPRS